MNTVHIPEIVIDGCQIDKLGFSFRRLFHLLHDHPGIGRRPQSLREDFQHQNVVFFRLKRDPVAVASRIKLPDVFAWEFK